MSPLRKDSSNHAGREIENRYCNASIITISGQIHNGIKISDQKFEERQDTCIVLNHLFYNGKSIVIFSME